MQESINRAAGNAPGDGLALRLLGASMSTFFRNDSAPSGTKVGGAAVLGMALGEFLVRAPIRAARSGAGVAASRPAPETSGSGR